MIQKMDDNDHEMNHDRISKTKWLMTVIDITYQHGTGFQYARDENPTI